jgi:hypothetical protein
MAAVDAALQEARALMKEERFDEATAALEGVPERINEEIAAVNEPRPAKAPRRKS